MNAHTKPDIEKLVIRKIEEISQDWDNDSEITRDSLLFTGLEMESLDVVVLCTAIQEHFDKQLPFPQLFAELGEGRRDLSVAELAGFVHRHIYPTVVVGGVQ